MSTPTAFLVSRRPDGFGEVYPLLPGQNYTMGRAGTNHIILNDDLTSREHAEVSFRSGRWRVRDLNSLNGTRVNTIKISTDRELSAQDEIHVGRTHLVFVDHLDQLPELPTPVAPPAEPGGMSIKKRLGQTRFLTPDSPIAPENPGTGRSVSRDLSILYRLALNMGVASTYDEVCGLVLDSLLEATAAEVGAVLSLPHRDTILNKATSSAPRSQRGSELEVTAFKNRDPSIKTYQRVSDFVSNEVLASHEAVLAEDINRDQLLKKRESLSDLGARSLICAPVMVGEYAVALIHLVSTDPAKPLDADDLDFTVAVARQLGNVILTLNRQQSLKNENHELRGQLKIESELIGTSPVMRAIERQIGLVASTNATCLIRGESGSGKELAARAIHFNSPRREGPFICLNCAALTETLLESELFGHEKGSFTGATDKKIGKFEAANHGTIFLDEIGEMNVGTQSKLLRILEGHPFERVGGNVPIRVDVRVVAATNRPLEEAVREGSFRLDLFFRLQVVELRLPPLRERKDDIPALADHFLTRFVRETGRKIRGFTEAAYAKLRDYNWPGNVRELRNIVERAVALSTGPMLDAGDIWLSSFDLLATLGSDAAPGQYEPLSLEELEKRHIAQTLDHTEWNKSQAAKILGIERSTLDRKIAGYGLKR
jgi:Nif-specific regulatory protein